MSATPDRSPRRVDPASRSLRLYGVLVRALPTDLRRDYGEAMLQLFGDLSTAAVRDGGRRRLARLWVRALGDLAWSVTAEWVARSMRESARHPPMLARLAAATTVLSGVSLLGYSQLRHPANLELPEYAIGYASLTAVLAVCLAISLATRVATTPVVSCGSASGVGWLLAERIGERGAGAVALGLLMAMIVVAASWEASRSPGRFAGTRAGAATGVLSGVVLLVISLAEGLATLGSVTGDRIYVREFAASGQRDLAAYVIGERVGGATALIVVGAAAGALLGFITQVAGRRSRWRKHRTLASRGRG